MNSNQHSVLSDVREALAAPRGDAGVDARMLALDSVQRLIEQLEAAQHVAERYHEMQRERDALALQVALEWGWPDAESVLTRLRGDRTSALATFTEEAVAAYLDVSYPASEPEAG